VDFAGQLTASERVFDVRPRRGPAPEHSPRVAPGPRAGPAVPTVLLLSRSCDAELDSVQDLLGRAGVPAERVNADELAHADLLIDAGSGTVRLNGRTLAPTVTWIRHFSPDAIEDSPLKDGAIEDSPPEDGRAVGVFRRASWQAAAGQLAEVSGSCLLAERPALLTQLRLARGSQVAVPRTIVTTDLAAATQAFSCPRLVVKAAGEHFVEAEPGRLTGIFATVVERDELARAARRGPPVVVQEYIEHEAELRVYYVAGEVHAFEVSKDSPAEPWTAPERVGVRPVDPPAAVAAATRALAAAMSLRFGAFDFLVRGGRPVFLEVNPDGDWRWAELKSGTATVTRAAARMLAERHHELRAAMRGAGGRLDLLSFLSGRA
jgi:hypothetical protein